MKSKFSVLISFMSVLLLTHCNLSAELPIKKSEEKQTQPHLASFVLIELGNHKGMRILGEKIKKEIDRIIIEELDKVIGHKKIACKYPESGVRDKLVLSVYYIGKIEPVHEAAFVNSLDLMQSLGMGLGPIGPLTITNDFDFFGTDNEIVVKISDPSDSLKKLRQDIKENLFSLNQYYRKNPTTKTDLFPLAHGDKYPFMPHVTFSRVPCRTIEKFAQESGVNDPELCQRIKNRIRDELFPTLSLPNDLKQIIVSAFQFWGHKHTSLKSFPLLACR